MRKAQIGDVPYRDSVKHLYVGVATVILMAVCGAALALLQLRQAAEMRATAATQNLAVSLANSIEGIIDTIDVAEVAAAYEIGRQLNGGRADAPAIDRFLARHTEHLNHVAHLRATDKRGDVIYGQGSQSPPANVADRDYFIALRDNPYAGLFVASPVTGRLDKKWFWPFARRIELPDGSFGGTVVASVSSDEIERMFAQLRLEPDSVIALRDSERGLIARHVFQGANKVPVGDRRLSPAFLAALQVDRQAGTYVSDDTTLDGHSRLYSYRRSGKYGFTVLVGVPVAAALAEWQRQAAFAALVLVVFVGALLIFSGMIRRAWVRQARYAAALLQLNEAAASREAFVNELMDTSTVAMFLVGTDGIIQRANHRMAEMFRCSIAQLVGAEYVNLSAPAEREKVRQRLQAYVADPTLRVDVERPFWRADGTEFWGHITGNRLNDADGRERGLVAVIEDITERRQLEERVRQLAFQDPLTVPARIVWTRFCNSGRLFHGISLTGFEG
jgi:PAS domain S-box-containing protein